MHYIFYIMKGSATSHEPVEFPEPFAVVPVLLLDGRRTWAVWTGRQWWGEHQPLHVLAWANAPEQVTRREALVAP